MPAPYLFIFYMLTMTGLHQKKCFEIELDNVTNNRDELQKMLKAACADIKALQSENETLKAKLHEAVMYEPASMY